MPAKMSMLFLKLIRCPIYVTKSQYSILMCKNGIPINICAVSSPGWENIKRITLPQCLIRHNSTEKKTSDDTAISANVSDSQVSTSVKERVKETTKTASYLGVILVGVAVTSVMFYTIFSELFSSKSPNSVYSKTLKKCADDNRIKDALGEPIKGFGEETRRGRRRHTMHIVYQKDGVEYMRMKFYLKGSRNSGTVHLEMKEDPSGNYVYRYLFVQVDDYTHRVIILEDNRKESGLLPLSPPTDNFDFSGPLNLS